MDIVVLGSAQDAGVPQIGCSCSNCHSARGESAHARTASSLAVLSPTGVILLDASPDLRNQWLRLDPQSKLRAVALTHAHAGHIAGLAILGKEGPQASGELWATPRTHAHIAATSILADGVQAMAPRMIEPGEELLGSPYIRFHPIVHRAERSDTVAIEVKAEQRLVYLPDTDAWDAATEAATAHLRAGDVLLFDATFWSRGELGHRDVAAIPHPFVSETLEPLRAIAARGVRVLLTHLNHTNPLCDPTSDATAQVRAAGLEVATDGMTLRI